MKTHFIQIFSLLLAVTSLGCQNKTKSKPAGNLTGTWRLYLEEPIKSNSHDAFSNLSGATEVLSFFPDGSYTRFKDSGELSVGKWKLSKDEDFITFASSRELYSSYKLDSNEYGRQTFSYENPSLNKKFEFIKEGEPLFNYKSDPLYYENNRWREKPAAPLTDREIQVKVANYVRHLALLLDAANDRKQDVISFEFSRGPIKIYNGGIGVHPYSAVPSHWKNCFYDENEALKGYMAYATAVQKTDFRLARTGNWVKDDARILYVISDVLLKQ